MLKINHTDSHDRKVAPRAHKPAPDAVDKELKRQALLMATSRVGPKGNPTALAQAAVAMINKSGHLTQYSSDAVIIDSLNSAFDALLGENSGSAGLQNPSSQWQQYSSGPLDAQLVPAYRADTEGDRLRKLALVSKRPPALAQARTLTSGGK